MQPNLNELNQNTQPVTTQPTQAPIATNNPKSSSMGHHLLFSLISLIILLVLVGGVYEWQHKKVDSLNQQLASANSQTKSADVKVIKLQSEVAKDTKTSSEPSTTTSTYTAIDATNLVQTAYNDVLAYENKQSGVSQAEVNTIENDVTPSLYSTLSSDTKTPSSDPILCAQAIPTAIVADAGTSSDGTATVTVNESFGSSTDKIVTTVDLSTLKIASITCHSS